MSAEFTCKTSDFFLIRKAIQKEIKIIIHLLAAQIKCNDLDKITNRTINDTKKQD